MRVQPALSASVSAGAALLFLANPLVGAAVGAGSLLAQTMLQDPIEQMFSYEYTVTGSWSDPVVTRSARRRRRRAARLRAPRRRGRRDDEHRGAVSRRRRADCVRAATSPRTSRRRSR